jgi:hypothetical protein
MSGGEIVFNATQSVTNLVFGRVVTSGWNAIVDRLVARRRTESVGGSTEQRQEAYSQFRRSAVTFRTSLAGLAATPPKFVGALWSVPLHLRLLHGMPDLSSALLDNFLAVHTVGRLPAIEAADTLLTRLSSAVDAFAASTGDTTSRQGGKVGVELSKVDEALADFTVAVRRDLGFGDVRTQSPAATEREIGQG